MERAGRPHDVSPQAWNSGDAFLPGPIRTALDQQWTSINGTPINGWTAVHFASGSLAKRAGLDTSTAFLLHASWEVWQEIIGMSPMPIDRADQLFDTLAFVGGYTLTRSQS